MPQGLAITLFTVVATASWLLVARAVQLRRAPAAALFVSVGVVIALWTTASLVQAQVDELSVRAVLLRFQLAMGSVGPTLWLVTLLRVAAPTRVRSLHLAMVATPAVVFAVALLTSPEGGPWVRAVTASADVARPVLIVEPGPLLWWVSLPYTYALLVAAIVVAVRTPRVRRGFGRSAPWVLLAATAAPLVASIAMTFGRNPVPGYDLVGLGLGVSVVVLHWTLSTTALFAPRERAFRAAFEAMHEPALVVASDGTVLEANPAAARLLGDSDRWRGANLTAAAPQLEIARRTAAGAPARRPLSGDFAGFELSLAHTAEPGSAADASLLVLHDRRQDRAREAQLLERSERDALTEVANRLGFEATLGAALAARHGHRIGLAYLDLDGFKEVNDTLGHAAGDAVLVECARRLSAIVRDGDVVARLGGDEFALILRDVTPDALAMVSERIGAALTAPIATPSGRVVIGASIGLAVAPNDGSDMDALLQAADARMYRQKRGKPGRTPRGADAQPR
jgi:diguanylate cyclase (GGDEF)-like protein